MTEYINRSNPKMSRVSKFNIETKDWQLFHQLYEVLKPIRKLSVWLECNSDVTISDVALFIHHLLYDRLKPERVEHLVEGREFVLEWKKKFLTLVDDVEQMYSWLCCAALDGRRKDLESWLQRLYDTPEHAADFPNCHKQWKNFHAVKHAVNKQIVAEIKQRQRGSPMHCGVAATAEAADTASGSPSGVALGASWLDAPIAPRRLQGSESLGAVEREVREYFNFQWRDMVSNPNKIGALQWWKRFEAKFPGVADLARRRLSVQASSACSERSFSKAGLILRKHRLSLSRESVDGLSLLGWHVSEEASQKAKANVG